MLLLSDYQENGVNPWPSTEAWSEQPANRLEPAVRSLWHGLTEAEDALVTELDLPGSGLDALVIIDASSESQLDALQRLQREGCAVPRAFACIAKTGRHFKGQRGRNWEAVEGNLHLCASYPVERRLDRLGPGLTMLPSVAVMDMIGALAGAHRGIGIKWVNDIVAGERKLAGSLTAAVSSGEIVERVTFGIGVNVRVAPRIAPTVFAPATGCISELLNLPGLTPEEALLPLLAAISDRLQDLLNHGPGTLIAAYQDHLFGLGERVRVWDESVPTDPSELRLHPPLGTGTLEGVADDLSILLTEPDQRILRGRLAYFNACQSIGC